MRLYYEHEILPKLSSQPYVGFSNPDTRLPDYFVNPLFTTIYGCVPSLMQLSQRQTIVFTSAYCIVNFQGSGVSIRHILDPERQRDAEWFA